ncbi:MAG: hypothetical protein JNL82_19910 [Myxococcales bacterium]|nr:hypothetical protein [Myxococcales bacterium]
MLRSPLPPLCLVAALVACPAAPAGDPSSSSDAASTAAAATQDGPDVPTGDTSTGAADTTLTTGGTPSDLPAASDDEWSLVFTGPVDASVPTAPGAVPDAGGDGLDATAGAGHPRARRAPGRRRPLAPRDRPPRSRRPAAHPHARRRLHGQHGRPDPTGAVDRVAGRHHSAAASFDGSRLCASASALAHLADLDVRDGFELELVFRTDAHQDGGSQGSGALVGKTAVGTASA